MAWLPLATPFRFPFLCSFSIISPLLLFTAAAAAAAAAFFIYPTPSPS
jgi:hypothetical protein